MKRILTLALAVAIGCPAAASDGLKYNNPGNLAYGPLARSFGATMAGGGSLPTPEGDQVCGEVMPGHYNESCWERFCKQHGETIDTGSVYGGWRYDTKTGCNYQHFIAPAAHNTGAMSCADLNLPHDPKPVRQWLRGYLSGAGYEGNYQAAAADIGEICRDRPRWTSRGGGAPLGRGARQ